MVQFHKGRRKDEVMKERSARFDKREGAVFIAKAQEKTPVFRTEKRRNPETGHTYPDCALVGVSARTARWEICTDDREDSQNPSIRVTDFGFHAALFFIRTHARLYLPRFAGVQPNAPPSVRRQACCVIST
jgi:hypothetical protein